MTENEKRVLELINEDEIVSFMRELIRARSDYPPGDTREVAELCAKKLREYGIEAELVCPPPSVISPRDSMDNAHFPSVIGTIRGEAGPTLLLNAHIDTVPAGDLSKWTHDPFDGVVEGGNVHGRGSGDDKGSVCAQVMAATIIKRAGLPLKGTLIINPVADEEAQSWRGAKWLVDHGVLKPDMVIVGEQTDNVVAVAERAAVFVKVHIKGRASHGAMPWKGNNATVHMCRFVNLLYSELVPEVQKITHKYLPLTTLSATHIQGGHQVNVIPESCMLEIDCRLTPGVTEEYVLRRMNELLRRLSEEGPAFEWEVVVTDSEKGTVTDTSPDHPLIRALSGSLNEVAGKEIGLTGYNQASDGRVFAKLKIPIAIFGPGDPGLGHSANEFVPIKQLVDATKALTLAIMRLLG